jgi:LysR family transcriptional regulator for metE and metH
MNRIVKVYLFYFMKNNGIISHFYEQNSCNEPGADPLAVLEMIHLEIIRAVHEKGSLTAAADSMFLTQSALSHSIKKLEEQLGVELWYRKGRKLIPTEAGSYLLGCAHRVLPQIEVVEQRLNQFGRGERGTFKIGIECHPCYKWLLMVIEPFLMSWPRVNLDVRQKFLFGGLGALFNHEIDLLVTPDPLFKSGICYEPVFDYEPVVAVGPDHPLRNHEYIEPTQLINETLYTYPVEPERLDIFTKFLIPAGIQPLRHITVETTEIMLQMVSCGRGVAALPRWIVETYSQEYQVLPLALGRAGVEKQIFLGFREEDRQVDYLQGFLNLALQIKTSDKHQ